MKERASCQSLTWQWATIQTHAPSQRCILHVRHFLALRINPLCSVHAPSAIDLRNQTLIIPESSEERCQPLLAVDEAFY